MHKSILDAVKMGLWDYEPPAVPSDRFEHTNAMPGTKDKLEALAERIRRGLPLWHPEDREELDEFEFKRKLDEETRRKEEQELYGGLKKPR